MVQDTVHVEALAGFGKLHLMGTITDTTLLPANHSAPLSLVITGQTAWFSIDLGVSCGHAHISPTAI